VIANDLQNAIDRRERGERKGHEQKPEQREEQGQQAL